MFKIHGRAFHRGWCPFYSIHKLFGQLAIPQDMPFFVFTSTELLAAEVTSKLFEFQMNSLVVTVILRFALATEPHLTERALHGHREASFELID